MEEFHCSFCGRARREVNKLISGSSVFICDHCVGMCREILAEPAAGEPAVTRQPRVAGEAELQLALTGAVMARRGLLIRVRGSATGDSGVLLVRAPVELSGGANWACALELEAASFQTQRRAVVAGDALAALFAALEHLGDWMDELAADHGVAFASPYALRSSPRVVVMGP